MSAREGYHYECKRDPKHQIRDANWMVTCPTCMSETGESTVRSVPNSQPTQQFGRVDFTYWPLTNEVEWHGHPPDDLTGDTPPMKIPLALVKSALAHITEATEPKPKPTAPKPTFGCR